MKSFSTLLTFRGLATLLLAVYLLTGPGVGESDIIAQMFGVSVISIAVLTSALFIYNYLKIIRGLRVELTADSAKEAFAGEPIRIFISVSRLGILPLFEIGLNVKFRNSSFKPAPVFINTNLTDTARDILTWKFPHRGIWQAEHLQFTFRDRLGFFEIKREIRNYHFPAIEILPARQHLKSIPVIVSSYSPGDIIPIQNLPQGDYYEMKRYQPSDGSKRIIWKIFARSGELISRYPEETVSPEGKTVIFLLADRNGDDAAYAAIEYSKYLKSQNIDIIASCAGNTGNPAANINDFRQSVLESVWNSESNPAKDLELLLENARKSAEIENLLIFCQADISKDVRGEFAAALKIAAGYQTNCIVCHKLKQIKQEEGYIMRLLTTKDKRNISSSAFELLKNFKLNVIEC